MSEITDGESLHKGGVDAASEVKPKAIFLMGPTASGKTALAIKLYQSFDVEIISVDSALVYRDMDIGTAKPSPAEMALAPHHLIDFQDPAKPYSVADFRDDALRLMAEIHQRGRIPLLVGGTMMYFKALLQGIADLPNASPEIRAQILREANELGWAEMHDKLSKIDPEAAERIHPNDSQRLQRALEVHRATGVSLTEWHQKQNYQGSKPWSQENIGKFPYNVTSFAIMPVERKTLHERIEKRFKQMLDAGFLEEVAALYQRGDLSVDLPAIKAVGYRQVWEYLAGDTDYDTMVQKGIAATRQLAKRQITWLRSWPDLHWIDSDEEEKMWLKVLKVLETASIYPRSDV